MRCVITRYLFDLIKSGVARPEAGGGAGGLEQAPIVKE
jgi:hypothetical protein